MNYSKPLKKEMEAWWWSELANESNSELGDRSIEILQTEVYREKKKNE